MNDRLRSWCAKHPDMLHDLHASPKDDETASLIDYICDQAGRIPRFASPTFSEDHVPAWTGASHSLVLRKLDDAHFDHFQAWQMRLETPLLLLELSTALQNTDGPPQLMHESPSAYLRQALRPLIETDSDAITGSEEVHDCIAAAWSASGCPRGSHDISYEFPSSHLGPGSHPELAKLHPAMKIKARATDYRIEIDLMIIPSRMHCKPWEWDPIDLMTRIARYKSSREA